jgi:NADH:ubiquinone oxidoreductase subunit C
MEKSKLAEAIKNSGHSAEVKEGKQYIEVTVPPEKFHSLMKTLREKEEFLFDYMFSLSGVDYGASLGVVYHLRSTNHGHSVVVKTLTNDRQTPVIDTVSDIWRTAEYHEREVFDLLGINFSNHPDLRRFFLEKTAGFPLRKDFSDDVNIVTK